MKETGLAGTCRIGLLMEYKEKKMLHYNISEIDEYRKHVYNQHTE
jgi:hypothetical protein